MTAAQRTLNETLDLGANQFKSWVVNAEESDGSGMHIMGDGPFAPAFDIAFEFDMKEAVGQRAGHGGGDGAVLGAVAGGADVPSFRHAVEISQAPVEDEFIGGDLQGVAQITGCIGTCICSRCSYIDPVQKTFLGALNTVKAIATPSFGTKKRCGRLNLPSVVIPAENKHERQFGSRIHETAIIVR